MSNFVRPHFFMLTLRLVMAHYVLKSRMKLSGKNILVTGAAKRLGREIALELAAAGANILIHYRDSKKEALSLKKEIEALKVSAFLCPFDLGMSKNLQRNIVTFVGKLPVPVHGLVNNAAIYYPTPVGKISDQDFDDFLTVNLKAPVFLAQAIAAQMLKRKDGVIVNITDVAGQKPFLNYLPYSISKAGLIAATYGLARELAPHVRVNGVSPGPILEPPQGLSAAAKRRITETTLLKRFGKARDVAQAARFLLENDFVTGQIVAVDGGKAIA